MQYHFIWCSGEQGCYETATRNTRPC
nr:unnamed protein product [Callosobruchus chinensis]CAH7752284.1 unnamed protein product [Callosobruchus chinensis]